jgi:hypothetical protein
MRNCNHIKSDGRPCNAPALRKHSYCFFHQQQLVRRRREYPDRLPILEDRAAVQVAIMQVLDRLYLKTIDYKAAALMLYGLQLASTNLKQDVFGRLNSEKVDRYYGNANETDVCTTDTSPAAVAVSRHSQLTTSLRPPSRCPRSHAEGVDLGSEVSKPGFGSNGNLVVPEARNEGSPARTAGFQAPSLNTVPEGRLTPPANTPAARLGGGAYKLDPERAAKLERIFSETIPEINACVEETSDVCHSERSEESLSSPNTLSGAPGSAPRCSALTWGRMNSPHHVEGHGFSRAKKPRPKVATSLAQPDVVVLTTHDSRLSNGCPTRIAHRWNGKDPRSMLRHHTPARRAEHASPARQCWVQNRGEAPSSLPQADVAVLTTHDSQLTTHNCVDTTHNKFFSLISRY